MEDPAASCMEDPETNLHGRSLGLGCVEVSEALHGLRLWMWKFARPYMEDP